MTRLVRAVIDSSALRDNLAAVRRVAPRSRVLAVVKANAYGHGLVPVALALADADAEIYTGTIQLPPTRGNLCRRMTFDNKTGELHDKGLGSCAESAANGGPPERYWRSNIEQVRKGFAGR